MPMDRQVIEEYVACGPRLREAVAGLTRGDLTARPGPGKWSILELVLHLADSDAISIDRMKRMLTEDNPPLLYADESAYVERLCSHEQSLEDPLTLFEVGRRQFARVLRSLPDEAFARRRSSSSSRRISLAPQSPMPLVPARSSLLRSQEDVESGKRYLPPRIDAATGSALLPPYLGQN